MKDSDIYRRAAEFIFADSVPGTVASCWAVDVAASDGSQEDAEAVWCPRHIQGMSDQRERYNELFRPDECDRARWGESWGANNVNCRILALCFMAAIAESEGR